MSKQQRILIVILAALAGLIIAFVWSYAKQPTATDGEKLIAVTSDAFGGPFQMSNQNGQAVTEKDYAGRYRLIYFGFTYCPAICPTELAKMTAALNQVGPDAKQILPIFVTVDPERDTAPKMKTYLTSFHPSFVGLTGTPDQVKAMLKEYKVYAAKVKDPAMTEYTMDHSSFVYFIGPDDRLLHIFKADNNSQDMAATIKRWLSAN